MSGMEDIDWDQRLKDNGMKTIDEVKTYRETVGWVPYEKYMKTIFHHCPGREFDDFSMRQDYFDRQLEPNKLLREAAYLLGLKYRPLDNYTEDDQKELEEEVYNKFMLAEFEAMQGDIPRAPWPASEGLV